MTFTLKFFLIQAPLISVISRISPDISVISLFPLTFPISQSPYCITFIPIYSASHSPVSLSTLLLNLMRVLAVTVLPAILVSPLQINTVMLQGCRIVVFRVLFSACWPVSKGELQIVLVLVCLSVKGRQSRRMYKCVSGSVTLFSNAYLL